MCDGGRCRGVVSLANIAPKPYPLTSGCVYIIIRGFAKCNTHPTHTHARTFSVPHSSHRKRQKQTKITQTHNIHLDWHIYYFPLFVCLFLFALSPSLFCVTTSRKWAYLIFVAFFWQIMLLALSVKIVNVFLNKKYFLAFHLISSNSQK